MDIRRISSGSTWEDKAAYSRALVIEHDGYAEVILSGCTGFNYSAMAIEDSVEAQARQAFRNVESVLRQAGGDLSHLVRVRYLLTSSEDFEPLLPVFSEFCSSAMPAATALICGLIDPRMKIEIEAEARVPR
jgi:enamine deaminase RidA (YjgF/YER057c/UK114 family)